MKKMYNSPILEAAELLASDIMNTSGEETYKNLLDANDFTQGDYVPFGQISGNP